MGLEKTASTFKTLRQDLTDLHSKLVQQLQAYIQLVQVVEQISLSSLFPFFLLVHTSQKLKFNFSFWVKNILLLTGSASPENLQTVMGRSEIMFFADQLFSLFHFFIQRLYHLAALQTD